MKKIAVFTLSIILAIVLFTACSFRNSYNSSSVPIVLSENSSDVEHFIDTSSQDMSSIYTRGQGISTLIDTTETYREYLMNLEIFVMVPGAHGLLVPDSYERYSCTIKVSLGIKITWPYIHREEDVFDKIADITSCVRLREGESFLDMFEISEDDFYIQEGYYTQIDKGSYQGILGNTIYYDVLEYGAGRNYRYNYGFLVELEKDIAAHVTFYSTNANRVEVEAYYRSIVETIQKA